MQTCTHMPALCMNASMHVCMHAGSLHASICACLQAGFQACISFTHPYQACCLRVALPACIHHVCVRARMHAHACMAYVIDELADIFVSDLCIRIPRYWPSMQHIITHCRYVTNWRIQTHRKTRKFHAIMMYAAPAVSIILVGALVRPFGHSC